MASATGSAKNLMRMRWWSSSTSEISLTSSNHNTKFFIKDTRWGLFIPDLVAFGTVVVDTKVIECSTDIERGQMLNYLKITKLRVGVILNFKQPKLEWERLVL